MLRGREIFSYTIIIAIIIGVYTYTLGYSFTYDDHHYIVESRYIKSWEAFFSIFQKDYLSHHPENLDLTRPLMPLSLLLDYKVWGLNPAGYHLTNIILHGVNSLLIYILASYISSGWVPLFASLFFAVHPIHVEPVVGITFREDLLATFFYLSSLLFYIRSASGSRLYYPLSILAFFLALLSKEMAATLPLVLLVYERLLAKDRRIKWLYHLPFWGILPFYFLFLYIVYSSLPSQPVPIANLWTIFPATIKVMGSYMRLLLFPFSLNIDYNYDVTASFQDFLFGAIVVITATIYLLKLKDRTLSFCIAFFFITFLPVLNIVPTFRLIADRFLYLPSVGFCIFFAGIVCKRWERTAKISIIGAIIIVMLYSLFTVERSRAWKDDLTLWTDVLKKSPLSARAYTAIGAYYLGKGRDDEAISMFKKAIEVRPDYDKGYYNLGAAYMRKGYIDAAIAVMKRAVEITPDYAKARFNLGFALSKMERYDEAIPEYERALRFMPDNAVLYNNLANAYSAKGSYEKALSLYEKANSIDPDYGDVYYNMGNAFAKDGRFIKAIESYEKAISLNSVNTSAYFNLGNVYLALGQVEKARASYEEILKMDPLHQGAKDALKRIMQEGQ